MNAGDELTHMIRQMAAGQTEEFRATIYGHVAAYDPQLHRVQCVIPSMIGSGGQPIMTGWMPLSTVWAGNGFGFQYAPFGGASLTNPTGGEQCKIEVLDRHYGSMICASLTFNLAELPPAPTLAPGEALFQHKSGAYLKFTKDGDVLISGFRDVSIVAVRDVNISAGRNAALHAAVAMAIDTYGYGTTTIFSGGSAYVINEYVTGAMVTTNVLSINQPQIPD